MEMKDILRRLMDEKGINQRWLADHAGVKEPTISRTLSGNSIPGSDLLLKIADALNVSCDYLLGRTADPTVASAQDSRAYIIGNAFFKCSERDKKIILAILGDFLPAAWDEMADKK